MDADSSSLPMLPRSGVAAVVDSGRLFMTYAAVVGRGAQTLAEQACSALTSRDERASSAFGRCATSTS